MAIEPTAMPILCSDPYRTSTAWRAAMTPRSAALRAVAQQMIGQHAGHHRLGHWRRPDADAGIVAALGPQFDLVAEAVDAAHRREDGAGGLHDQPADDVLAGRDA